VLYPKPERARGRSRKGAKDPVSLEVRILVLTRDGGCLAFRLDPGADECRGRLTLDHVKDQPRMGKRAPSDPSHLATICEHHHLDGWATAHRSMLREYLRTV
jgi:hypothetical protein